ncbi:MAG: Histidine kinase [Myxococcales bacterium]|nr:Histidine kinase [Myxococcales bacterium]
MKPLLVAIACVAAGALARLGLHDLLRDSQPWLTFWPAMLAASWFGGWRAGAMAALASIAIVIYFLVPPVGSFAIADPAHVVGIVVFFGCSVGFGIISTIANQARTHEEALRSAADRERTLLRTMFEQAPVTISVLDGPELRYVVANAATRKVYGDRKDLIGKTVLEVNPALANNATYQLLKRVYETGDSIVEQQKVVTVTEPDGSTRDLEYMTSYQPIHDATGAISGVLAIGVDTTVQVAAIRELDEARSEAQSANRTKDEFLAMLGHELRNPLSPIVTAVELLQHRGQSSRELQVIRRQVDHMVRLVDDLLDVSRIVRGKVELRRSHVEIAAVIESAVEMVSTLIERTGHVLVIDVPRGLVVDGDPQRLTQVFTNLLANAIKYSEPKRRIEVTASATATRVTVRVTDHGVGIEPELIERLFEPFVQQPQAGDRARGGLGLGLAIVRHLVELHGGVVTARSEGIGRGSEMSVELPRIEAPDQAPVASVPDLVASPIGQRILVVDDNEDLADGISELLTTMGHTTRIAHDGPRALEAIESFKPTLALLDIGLPVMDGYELARRLREVGVTGPLVALTGYGQESDRAKTRAAGFAEHLVKPIDAAELRKVLARIVH